MSCRCPIIFMSDTFTEASRATAEFRVAGAHDPIAAAYGGCPLNGAATAHASVAPPAKEKRKTKRYKRTTMTIERQPLRYISDRDPTARSKCPAAPG